MSKPFKLVYIEWEDAFGCTPYWSNLKTVAAPEDVEAVMARTVGWVCRESKTTITVVPHITSETKLTNMQGCGDMTIPRSAIRKMVCLKIPDNTKTDAATRKVLGIKKGKRGVA